ncbi:MAG TPA: VWA domain-containing protein [Caldilineaceae bacterium]|nr:VWA domain-containing protein [Caldilineaceae bacterium]
MEERIVQFIAALRAGGVRVSLAESADALNAVDILGVQDRESFRLSLRTTLVKEASGIPTFEELFPLFFGSGEVPPMNNIMEDMSPEEAQMLAQAMRMFNEQLRQMMEKLLRGEQLSQQEMERLGQMVGLNRMDDLRYQDWMAQRMIRAMRFKEVQEALKEMMELMQQMGMSKQRLEQLRELLKQNQQSMQDQMRQFAGQRIAENMSEQRPDQGIDELLNRPFNALSDGDMQKLRKEVHRLANRLRSRIALRQKRAKSGQLDAKATIRTNLKHGGVPIEIKHRDHRLKPKLVVICDISTSMRPCSELMLSLVHALQDVITKTHAFAFIDHLEYISPDFVGRQANEAIHEVLVRMPPGYYSTDLGYSLTNFARDYLDTVDHRTTVIMVGDARNNYNNPQLDIFKKIARRSRRTIWINTEQPMLWGSGDSDMLDYAPLCDAVVIASTLGELTEAVDQMLTQH